MTRILTASGSQVLPHAWEYSLQTRGALTSAPLVAGDRLVCTSSTHFYALDIYTGKEIEVKDGFPCKRAVSIDPPQNLITQTRGTLYYLDGGKLVGRQLSDGKIPQKLSNGKLEPRWTPPALTNVDSINANDDVVIVTHSSPNTTVSGFDPASGTKLWKRVVSQTSPGPVGASRDAIVFVADSKLVAVNIGSGDTRFQFAPTGDPLSRKAAPQIGKVGDKQVVVTSGTAVYGIDLLNGRQLWKHSATQPTSNIQWRTPAISEQYNCVVVANSDGEVFVLELTTGVSQWTTQVRGVDRISIVEDKIYIDAFDNGRPQLHVFDVPTKKKSYTVDLESRGQFGMATGHAVLFHPSQTSIKAYTFGEQNAALFNGRTSRITVGADAKQFDFSETDFTIEAWICTTRGGEVVSGFPTTAGSQHHGFRVNVTDQGRVRFSILNSDASSSFAAITVLTDVTDGSWHHVAVVRRGATVEMYVDAVSAEVNTATNGTMARNITGNIALTFGAFVPAANRAQAFFSGLMREIRVWDGALDASKLQSRMQVKLIGTEPQLLGYWRLDGKGIKNLENRVLRQPNYTATPVDIGAFATELALDAKAFPYLLDQANSQWPYYGHWAAHGEYEISTAPALDRFGMLAFGDGESIYGVYASDGARAWSKGTPAGASMPVAAGGSFFCVTGAEGLISIDAVTGKSKRVQGFVNLFKTQPDRTVHLPAPATDGNYLAAVSADGKVLIVENSKIDLMPGDHTWEKTVPTPLSGDLSIANGKFYLLGAQQLHQFDPENRKVKSTPVTGAHYLVVGDVVFCQQAAGTVIALSAADLTTRKATFTVPGGGAVTGMCASSDADLLVVATDQGDLYGLTFATMVTRWVTRIPVGTADTRNTLNVPVIEGRTIFCTSNSGTVAAVDAVNGEFRSLYSEPTRIKYAPVVEAGTIYYGCAEAPAAKNLLDGALHSLVFGRTNVLRLNLDRTGARETKQGYASVTSGGTLQLIGVDASCVEAWVNTRNGGEVLSICPTSESGYGLRLWLDQDGTIHYTSVDLPDRAGASWERLSGTVSSGACDGRWHHIAVSRHARELTIYLDGVALHARTTFEQVAQPALSAGLKVFIGADATAPAPTNFFSGMIAEVRVWDTYLNATRISDRMHDKLVGNDPDLIAYWNFDMLSVYDGTRRGHDGKLETGGGSSGYWLADLNFTHPSYPYLETAGEISEEGAAKTIYKLTVTARSADGAALTDHEVRLWYVRHKNETGPATIKVLSPTGVTELGFVPLDHGDDKSAVARTGNDGKIVFKITTEQPGHGPSLDLRPTFLPPNERYHVNVLIDNQKLQRPSPPRLEAQASLIQDYHWNTGDNVNESRDRSTWRAVITAVNSDGRARAGERLQLWATEHVEVEVDGRVYPINPNNYQSFTADDKGELTVVLAAKELRAPALSVWAGFMHRDERYTIPLDREVHKRLSELKPDDLSEPRMLNWKPGYQEKALVKEGYKPHAPKVATAIQHVMSVTQEPEHRMRAGVRAKRTGLLTDRRNFSDMRQVDETPMSDRVDSLRTMRHIVRQVPLEPEGFRESLSGTLAFENSIGFLFSKQNFDLRPLKSIADVEAAFPRLLMQEEEVPLLGNIFEDAWNFIENAAEAAWREAKKIAIYIADTVTLVVEYADKVVKKVVASVKEAIDAVVHILKMIEALIEEVIHFLMLLFDWSAILDAHKILKKVANSQLKAVRQITARGKDDFLKRITGAFNGSPPPVDLSKHSSREMSAASCRANDPHPQVQAQVNSVHGKYVNDKVDDRRDEIDFGVKPSLNPIETVDESATSMALAMAGSLTGALSDPLGISFADIYQNIKDLISGDIDKIIKRLLSSALIDFDKVGKALDCVEAVLNAPIEIPFLTKLYRWITDGEQLTLMDVFCLAMAIPTHIGYAIYTFATTGKPHKFSEDAKTLDQLLLTAENFYGEAPLLKSGLGDANVEHNRAMHWCYFVFYQLYTMGSGFLKGTQIMNPGGGWKKENAAYVPGIVIDGLVSKTLLYTAGMTEEGWNWFDQSWNSALYGILVLLDLYLALDTFYLEDKAPVTEAEKAWEAKKDGAKTAVKIGASIAGCVLLGLRIDAWVNKKSPLSDTFQARDVLNAIGMMFTFDDTSVFVKAVGPENAAFVVGGETYLKVAAGCVHIAAVATS